MRKGLTLISIAALSLGLAACHKKADTTAADNAMTDNAAMADTNATVDANAMTAVPSPAMTGQMFADTAAKSDAFEIAEGKLAEKMGKDKDVKDFAAKMVAGHSATTLKLKAAAMVASPAITPDPTLKPDQQAKVDALGKLTGDDFDKQYAADQVAAHTDALAALQTYGSAGDVPSLKSFASSTAPTVSSHLDMAKKLP